MDKERVTVWLRQGEKPDQIYMSITMDKDVADMMGEIRGEDPEKWANKDFELCEEAHKRIKAMNSETTSVELPE